MTSNYTQTVVLAMCSMKPAAPASLLESPYLWVCQHIFVDAKAMRLGSADAERRQ